MRKSNSHFITKFISETGLDKDNGTYYGFVELDHYFCVAIAEGYDDEGGSKSARIAVDAAIEAFVSKPGISAKKLRSCLYKAHRSLQEQSVRIRLKAGIILFVSDYTRCRYAECGNVVLYLLRGNNILHQSLTQTVYQTLLECKQLPAEETELPEETDPAQETRNMYHYLGGSPGIRVSAKMKLKDDDQILIATESFWNRVSKIEVLDAFESFRSAEEFLGDLQEVYLRGSTEYIGSYTLAGVNVNKIYQENTKWKKRAVLWAIILFLLIAAGLTVFYFYNRYQLKEQQKIRDILSTYEEMGDEYLTRLDCESARQQYEKSVETGTGLKDKEEQLRHEKELSDKISIGLNLDQANSAYKAMEFETAMELYEQLQEQTKGYQELEELEGIIERNITMVQYGMEINTYIDSGVVKEAKGDMEGAEVLYGRAESMLRIVNYPELLQQVQLSLLRVREQAKEDGEQEEARQRDQVILAADEQAAMEAVLAEDYETAITLYTKIRDGYIALESNEEAMEITMLLTLLQKQSQTAREEEESKELYADRLLLLQEEALLALMNSDIWQAVDKYDQMIQIYIASGNTEGAAMAEAAAEYLKSRQGGEAADGQ